MKNYCNPVIKSIITREEAIFSIVRASIISNNPLLLTYINLHCFNILYQNEEYAHILFPHFKYYSDGVGIRFALKFLKINNVEKFNASDINESLFKMLEEMNLPVALIGGKFGRETLNKKNLKISLYLNGYEDIENFDKTVNFISSSGTRIIIIGMGVPRQELFAYNLSQKVAGLVIICVGNFLEFYFGTVKRAPKIYHNSGFEWVYRIYSEPRRLWRRYLIGIPLFIFRIAKLKISNVK